MATRWADGRAGTAAGDGSSDTQTFGLGTVGSAKIGGFRIRQQTSDVVADGGTPKLLYSSDSGSTWLFTNNYLAVPSKEMLTYTTQSSVVPAAFKTVSGKLQIEAYISKTEGFDFSNDIKLDGLATMEVIYL
jgi:Zn-dependent alcohol dehydrogenase